jgi:hypothetical protein
VTAGWAAGSVRARLLAQRRIGAGEARRVAGCGSLAAALSMLAATAYHQPRERQPAGLDVRELLAARQHAIAAGLLWNLRVLAGWLPRGGTPLMRALAGWFEIANLAERLASPPGSGPDSYFDLGALATAWPRLRDCRDLAAVRAALAASAWRDPGGDTAGALMIGLRARWAQRVSALGDPASTWAAAAVALLLAGELAAGRPPASPVLATVASRLLGPAAGAGTVTVLARDLPARVRWVLGDTPASWQPWQGEAAWWHRVEQDGQRLLSGTGFGRGPVIGSVAMLAADARRVRSALELAARGGGPIEVFDAVV